MVRKTVRAVLLAEWLWLGGLWSYGSGMCVYQHTYIHCSSQKQGGNQEVTIMNTHAIVIPITIDIYKETKARSAQRGEIKKADIDRTLPSSPLEFSL